MKYTPHTCVCILVLSTLGSCGGKILRIEAESAKGNNPKRYRSNASNGEDVWLHRGAMLSFSFCLIRETNASINNVMFSNDGGADTCSVELNGVEVGEFESTAGSDGGLLWNVFKSSGSLGSSMTLESRWNTITLLVNFADDYGIEIDHIDVNIEDDEVNEDIFTCILPCLSDLPVVTAAAPGLTEGRAVQRSYSTQCAEEDNVDVAIFNTDVTKYEITASLPTYRSFLNLRDEDTRNCPFLTPIYWLYENVIVSPNIKSLTSNSSELFFGDKAAPEPYTITKIAVTFTLEGRKKGYIDSEIGSTLYMTMNSPDAPSDVVVSYSHRNGTIIEFSPVTFSDSLTSAVWNIPDFTWKEDLTNNIFVTVQSTALDQQLVNFRLERRYMGPDVVIPLYSSGRIVLEGIRVDFWWQAPETMELVRPSTGDTWNNIAYFRIYVSLPWSDGYSQVFVLYQDGNMRLLNPTPHGLDWTPFGTSVILGQTDVDDFRPAVSITKVEIEPEELTMKIIYSDGSSTDAKLVTSIEQTKLYVSNIDFKKSTTTHPFATFRSMYVQVGNTDSDSIVSDTSTTNPILGGDWTTINGTSFLLYRRCESKHLTQSPDIRLQVTETE
ncbi:hypothetical protein SNE40_007003 [Patella caerulea]|uniref:Uncharacterized protein n=1 Tax=Patella caerulea TaxID=87958 RepID=A0AAN8K3T4_PATCE